MEFRRRQKDRSRKLEKERYKMGKEPVIEYIKRFYAWREVKRRNLEL